MSNWRTQSTRGKSSPRAAMLVQSRTPYLFQQKVKQMAMRFFCFWWPCSSQRGQPSLNFRKASQRNRTCLQVDRKTTNFILWCVLRKEQKVLIFSSGGTTMQYWVSLAGVSYAPRKVSLNCSSCRALTPCSRIFSGSVVQRLLKASMSRVIVAEKSRVCARGRQSRMALSGSRKPISSITSASSRTNICRLLVSKPQVYSRCWRRRPGVQMMIFMSPMRSRSNLQSFPPMTSPTFSYSFSEKEFKTSKTCMASSRTGTTTTAPSPSMPMKRRRQSFSISGTRYARVLPDPVREDTKTSRSARAWGMAHRCTSVILLKPRLLSPRSVAAEMGRSAKLILNLLWNSCSSTFVISRSASSSLQSQKYSPGLGDSRAMRCSSDQTSVKRAGLLLALSLLIVDMYYNQITLLHSYTHSLFSIPITFKLTRSRMDHITQLFPSGPAFPPACPVPWR